MKIKKVYQPSLIIRILTSGLLCGVLILSACSQTPTETPVSNLTQTSTVELTETPESVTTPSPSPTPTSPPTLNVRPEDLVDISLRFMHPWPGDTAEVIEQIARQFSLTNPWDIWVDTESHGGETALLEALLLDAETGDTPELVAVHPYQLNVLDGTFFTIPLLDYFDHPEWGFDDDARADIPEVLLDPFALEEELIALPVAPQATVLFYNQTWAESLGFAALPEDAGAFRQQSCGAALANREDINPEKADTGGWIINLQPEVLSGWYRAYGGELPDSGRPQFNTDAGRDALGYLKSLSDQGCFWRGRRPEPYFYFANRFALSYAGRLDGIPEQQGWMTVAENEDRWTVMGFPGPEGQVMVIDGPGLMVAEASPEEQLAAWLFARHLLEPEVQERLVRTLFTVPVRRSALASLGDFAEEYPQWGTGVALIDEAVALPMSEDWGYSQWLLQDAAFRLLQFDEQSPEEVLEELDQMIIELGGTAQ
ncbi:MAG: extracellular solute-binding protein [Brevefilum sp.]